MADNPVNKTITNKTVADAAAKVVVNPPVHNDPEFVRAATAADVEAIKQKPDSELTMDDILTDAVTVVDYRVPNFLDVQPKDRTWAFRWVNRKHDGDGGNRYLTMRAMGWVNVESVEEIDGDISQYVSCQDKSIVYNDVILMKMPRAKLYGMYKANMIKSNRMFNRGAIHEAAKTEGNKSLAADLSGTPRSAYAGKVGIFIPGSNDIPGSGDVSGGTPGGHQAR